MKIEVIGKQRVDYISRKTGKEIKGHKLFFSYSDHNVEGVACDSVYIPDSWNMVFPYCLPASAEVYYNRFGSIESLIFND